jgi:hypothetical protein
MREAIITCHTGFLRHRARDQRSFRSERLSVRRARVARLVTSWIGCGPSEQNDALEILDAEVRWLASTRTTTVIGLKLKASYASMEGKLATASSKTSCNFKNVELTPSCSSTRWGI